MDVKLIAAILVTAATASAVLAQGASTEKPKADAQKVAQIISSDSNKTELPSDYASDTWVHGYGRHNKDCLEWTDTCVKCARNQSGGDDYSCSNIGIACQPEEVRCVKRTIEKTK
jgi:hypothetical protein